MSGVKKGTAILMCVLFLFSAFLPVCCVAESQTESALPALTAKGRKIVDENGEQVILRGINVGGWLIMEEWMSPYTVTGGNAEAFRILEERFGREDTYALFDSYYDHFLTARDIEMIAELGYNCVRVPFWYRNFMYDDQGTWILDENGNRDLSRLEWIVAECEKNGLYVILDLHGAPGAQGDNEHCGELENCRLFEDSEQGEQWRALTAEIWKTVAERFVGNNTVCMYDILNEPLCDVSTSNEDFQMLWEVYDQCYDAIRAVDEDTMITMEGTWRYNRLPRPGKYNWKNVVYQIHLYDKTNETYAAAVLESLYNYYKVPLFIGEFHPKKDATWDYIFALFNTYDVSWCAWSYKGVNEWMFDSNWFVYSDKPAYAKADVENDSYETLLEKWGENLQTDSEYFQRTPFYDLMKPYLEGKELDKADVPKWTFRLRSRFWATVHWFEAIFVGL